MSEESSGSSTKTILVAAAALGAVAILYWSWSVNLRQATIELGYYCLSCKKTENITAYQDDYPNNWRQYPGGGSDSVLYCIKCKKGRAHPVNDCKICGTVFILHLFPRYDQYGDPSCPKCDAAYGEMAKSRGIDVMPKELNP